MNVTDLQDVLDDRSHPARIPAGLERMAGVRARVSAIRQRRVAVIGALATVVLMIIWYAQLRPDVRRTDLVTAPPIVAASFGYHLIDGFPEYADGAKVIATGSASTQVGLIRVTAVAASLGFVLATRCQVARRGGLSLTWTANGDQLSQGDCGATLHLDTARWQAGEPVDFVVRIASTEPGPVPDGTFAVAVMSRVAYADYPFPPRPARLEPLPEPADGRDQRYTGQVIDSVAANPDAPVEVRLPVAGNASLDMVAQTPGMLRIYTDGLLQAGAEWWDYGQSVYDATLRPGEQGARTVTLRLVPQHMTGAWRAVLYNGQT
jgi:hypothetical protein